MNDERNTRTIVYCPKCKHRTYTAIRYGEISIHCKFCGHDFDVIIRSPEFSPEETEAKAAKS
jgi:transcription elongation factor Elf1